MNSDEHDRPLFGRLDGHFVVEPFNPAETAQALGGSRSPVEVFDTQLITGGFPELVAHARRFRSVQVLVEDALSCPNTLLADVAQINLAGELTDGTNTRLVLEAVGADEIGVGNFSRIALNLRGETAATTAVSLATDILTGTKRILAVDTPPGTPRRDPASDPLAPAFQGIRVNRGPGASCSLATVKGFAYLACTVVAAVAIGVAILAITMPSGPQLRTPSEVGLAYLSDPKAGNCNGAESLFVRTPTSGGCAL